MNSIAIIKEQLINEQRVILTPINAGALISRGHNIIVEENAGIKSGYSNEDYIKIGAKIVPTEEAWNSKVVLKLKPPIENEFRFLSSDKIIAGILHAEGDIKLIKALIDSKVTAYSFEFFKTESGEYPMSIVGGELAGKIGVFLGAYFLMSNNNGMGKLLAYQQGSENPIVVVIGYGNVGYSAIKILYDLGCKIYVFGRNKVRLRKLQNQFSNKDQIEVFEMCHKDLADKIKNADLVLGAILISTYDTEPIISESMVKSMKKGSVIIDLTSGYGSGYIETFDRNTSINDMTFEKFGVIHCKIDNLPSLTPNTYIESFGQNCIHYLDNFLSAIFENRIDIVSRNGLIVKNGELIHPELTRHYKFYTTQDETN